MQVDMDWGREIAAVVNDFQFPDREIDFCHFRGETLVRATIRVPDVTTVAFLLDWQQVDELIRFLVQARHRIQADWEESANECAD